jgi:2-hydroxy-3-oxopropionate reductase
VSGGELKAISGTLAIMVGGSEAGLEKIKPIHKCMGSSVTFTGPVGAGNTTKLANQIMVACKIAAMGEGLTLTTRCRCCLRSSPRANAAWTTRPS